MSLRSAIAKQTVDGKTADRRAGEAEERGRVGEKKTQLNLKVPSSLRRRFKLAAVAREEDMSVIAANLIEGWLKEVGG